MIPRLALLFLLALTTAAQAQDIPSACNRLRDAVTRYDVNVSIPREHVKRWNEVIRASRELRKAAGCPVTR